VRLLRQPRLALLFGGAALNEIGSWASIIAFWGYAAYRFHASPGQIALVSLMWTAPGALFGLASGWPIDRFGPKAVMLVADAWGTLTALAMMRATSYGQLAGLVFASGLVGAFGRPAANALPPRLVEDDELLTANSLMGLTTELAIVIGPLVAAIAISVWSIKVAFLVDALTFVAGALSLLPVRLGAIPGRDDHSSTSDLLAGVRLSWRELPLRRTLTMALVMFCSWGGSMVMEPLYVRDVLHRSGATFGWLQTVFGVGLILSTISLPRLGDRVVNLRIQGLTLLVSAISVALYLASYNVVIAFVGVALWGAATGAFLPPFYTLLQRGSPAESHGRVMAVAGTVNGVSQLITTPLAGVLVGAIGIRTTALIEVAALLGVGALGWTWGQVADSSESRAAATAG
jgi:MFS family permease